MKHFEIDEAISASTYRDVVYDAIADAYKNTLAVATKRKLLGTPSTDKIKKAFADKFPVMLKQSLEANIDVISMVLFNFDATHNAAVNPTNQYLIIGRVYKTLLDWANVDIEHGVTSGDQMVKDCHKAINWAAGIIVHEIVHLIQQQRQPGKQKDYHSLLKVSADRFYKAVTQFASDEDNDIYHASPQEIPAYAHNVVYDMITQALGEKPLQTVPEDEIPYVIQELRDLLKDLAQSESNQGGHVQSYRRFRGDDKRRQRVYNRFLKSVYQEVQSYIQQLQAGYRGGQPVTESFDKPYEFRKAARFDRVKYQWTGDDGRVGQCQFRLEDSDMDNWGLMFAVDNSTKQTGGGDAQRIFATVVACFKDWAANEGKDANGIAFAGDMAEPSRLKLYDRFAKMMPRFGFEDTHSNFQAGNSKFYEFERTQPLAETFDKPLPWSKRMQDYGIIYMFKTPQDKRVDMMVGVNHSGVADIVFEVDGTMEKTGGGEAMAIFATVIDCVKNALGDPYMDRAWKIEYSADKTDESRKKLYSRLGKLLEQAGYRFAGTHETNLYTVFEYVHPEKKKEHEPKKPELIPPEEQIEETLNQPYDWKKIESNEDGVYYEFNVPELEKPYGVDFAVTSRAGWYEIVFMSHDAHGGTHYGITGSGDAFRVFATVADIIKQFVRDYKPELLMFSAKEKSRIKLYDRLARLIPKLGFEPQKTIGGRGYYAFKSSQSQSEQIEETFDNPAKTKWHEFDTYGGYAIFDVGDNRFNYGYATETDDEGIPVSMNIVFEARDGGFGVTGKGGAQQVFATVVKLTREVLDKYPSIRVMTFSSDEASRTKLYERMAKTLLPGWELSTKKFTKTTTFALTRREEISETFNSPVETNWTMMSPSGGTANFTVGDVEYKYIYHTKQKTRDGQPMWVWIEFRTNGKKQSYGVTGTGNAAQVLATATQLTRELLDRFPSVYKLIFSAKEKSRQSLYAHMIKRLLPSWETDTKKDRSGLTFTVTNTSSLAESASSGATCSGSVATVARPLGGVVRRSGSSILAGINTAEETPNTPEWMKSYKKKK